MQQRFRAKYAGEAALVSSSSEPFAFSGFRTVVVATCFLVATAVSLVLCLAPNSLKYFIKYGNFFT
jgi:hypothetical protein